MKPVAPSGDPIVIVGGGAASASAAYTLRGAGYEGDLLLVSEDPFDPYERPPLSKSFLSGELDEADLGVLDDGWYSTQGVQIVHSRALSVDPSQRRVQTETEGNLSFSSLLLATGGTPRRFSGRPDGARYLRTLEEARDLRKALGSAEDAVVIGGGFLGSEVAATAASIGVKVVLVEMAPRMMMPLPEEVSGVMERLLRDAGVAVHAGTTVKEMKPDSVLLDDGTRARGDVILAALGIDPNDELAARAGIATDDGILVDEGCRTSAPGVFAAGDVARCTHPAYSAPVRMEHHDNALQQAAVAARAMLGEAVSYVSPFWFWTDQLGVNLQVVGRTDVYDDRVFRGDLDHMDCTILYLQDGVVTGAVTIERPTEMRAAIRMVRKQIRVEQQRLAGDDLRRILREPAE